MAKADISEMAVLPIEVIMAIIIELNITCQIGGAPEPPTSSISSVFGLKKLVTGEEQQRHLSHPHGFMDGGDKSSPGRVGKAIMTTARRSVIWASRF